VRYAWLALVLGCSYDPSTLAPTDAPVDTSTQQRDFDADGIADDVDRCPHISNPADPDGDNDGVGDACDPRPSTNGDQRIAFYGFADPAELGAFTQSAGTWTIAGNRLVQEQPIGLATIELPMLMSGVRVETSFEVDTLTGGVDAEIGTCSGVQGGAQHYCCDVIRKASSALNAELWAQYTGEPLSIDIQSWTGSFGPGSRVDVVNEVVPDLRNCTLSQTPVVRPLFKNETGPIDGTVELYMKNATAKYRYIFVVEIGS
jgi:hypothetical protein